MYSLKRLLMEGGQHMDKITVIKTKTRYPRQSDIDAIDRVNRAVPIAEAMTLVSSALAAKITSLRRSAGLI